MIINETINNHIENNVEGTFTVNITDVNAISYGVFTKRNMMYDVTNHGKTATVTIKDMSMIVEQWILILDRFIESNDDILHYKELSNLIWQLGLSKFKNVLVSTLDNILSAYTYKGYKLKLSASKKSLKKITTYHYTICIDSKNNIPVVDVTDCNTNNQLHMCKIKHINNSNIVLQLDNEYIELRNEDILIETSHIDEFFTFKTLEGYAFFTRLTSKWAKLWWQSGCPNLKKICINKNNYIDMHGNRISYKIIDVFLYTNDTFKISSYITKSELNTLLKEDCNGNHKILNNLQLKFSTMSLKAKDKQIINKNIIETENKISNLLKEKKNELYADTIISIVYRADFDITKLICNKVDKSLIYMISNLRTTPSSESKKLLLKMNSNILIQILNCIAYTFESDKGFTYFYPLDIQLAHELQAAYSFDKSRYTDEHFMLSFTCPTQNIKVQRKFANIAKKEIFNSLGISVSFSSYLS